MTVGKERARPTPAQNACFASDNVAGVSPEILEALSRANTGAAAPYGADAISTALSDWVKDEFGAQAEIFPVFNGTGANVVAMQAMVPRWGAVICTQQAHANNDEGAAPERLGALKLLARPGGGKLEPEDIEAETSALGFVHAAQPMAVTLTQSTEVGTLYSVDELAALTETAHSHGMGVHLDGARLANAAAALGVSLAETTSAVGVDAVSLGGTKNGALAAEAVVVINPERMAGTDYIRKYSMQLASKQRFVAAQLWELFSTDLWLRNARHANAQAAELGLRMEDLQGVKLTSRPTVNAVFCEMPPATAARIRQRYVAHTWSTTAEGNPVLRLMCSWQTTAQEIDDLVAWAAG